MERNSELVSPADRLSRTWLRAGRGDSRGRYESAAYLGVGVLTDGRDHDIELARVGFCEEGVDRTAVGADDDAYRLADRHGSGQVVRAETVTLPAQSPAPHCLPRSSSTLPVTSTLNVRAGGSEPGEFLGRTSLGDRLA